MSDTVKLHNTNETMTVEVFSADGDSIHLMPRAKIDVNKKFLWNLPVGVVVFRQKHTVFGAKETKEVNSKKAAKENSVPLDTQRTTVKSS